MLRKQLCFWFRVSRKAKIYKRPIYSGIPDFHKPHFIDIHDTYTYRDKETVMNELKSHKYELNLVRHLYSDLDPHNGIKNRKAIITFSIDQFKFTDLQLDRFKVLMGPRYNESEKTAKMACEMFPEYQQNQEKLLEQLQEVIMESKRAP